MTIPSTVNTNVPSMTAQRILAIKQTDVNRELQRIATGYQINRGADDPAGLIASENLRRQMEADQALARSMERNEAVANTAEASLAEVSNMMVDAQALAVASANTSAASDAEIEAMQLEMDAIVSSVDRTISTARFNGQPLFDGNLDIPAGDASMTLPQVSANRIGEVELFDSGGAVIGTANLSDLASGGPIGLGTPDAQRIISAASQDIATIRGEIGAFTTNAIVPTRDQALVSLENTSAANSIIRDTDFAAATSALTRSQILSSAATSSLASANASPERSLDLLG